MASLRRVLTLSGKGCSLSSATVFAFAIASPPMLLKIDPCTLARLSSSPSGHNMDTSSSPARFHLSLPEFLTPEEARASILLLLYKVLLGGSSCSYAASKLLDILNKGNQIFTMHIYINRYDDEQILSKCWKDAAVHGICAIVDHTSSSLATIADAVAALSFQALRANASTAFSVLTDSVNSSSEKYRAAVVSDFKILLNGTELRGNGYHENLYDIPMVHGRLRSLCKSIHHLIVMEMNSIHFVEESSSRDLTTLLSSLAFSLQSLGETSLFRAKLSVDSLVNGNLFPTLVEGFNAECPNLDILNAYVTSFIECKMEKDFIRSLHEMYSLTEAVRQIISWEATISFMSLEGKELMQPQEDIQRGITRFEKKETKRKVMGKGTTLLMQFIKDRLQSVVANVNDSSALPEKVAKGILSLFDMKGPGFEHLLQKVKDIIHSNELRPIPQLPKGTRDFSKEQMAIREKAFSIISDVFKRHGAMALDTPSFELRETLTGKYREDSKLIYNLTGQGEELCALRYDLTVPFARHVAMNSLTSFRRYQMAKVYRRDHPTRGRYREFYQCDFDIAGDETIGADFEVIRILTELLDELNIGDYEIKLNHQKLLDGMLNICGVPSHKMKTICSSIDKLDKQSYEQIKWEMIEEKGLDADTVEKIGSFLVLRGHPWKLLSELKKEGSEFLKNDESIQAFNDLEKLFQALESSRCIDKVVLDLSVSRGLDYYTGVIFEAVFKGAGQVSSIVASIAGGGRYDNLIGMFGTTHVPAVGVSLGLEYVFTILEQLQKDQKQPSPASEMLQVLVSIVVDDLPHAAKLVSMCWDKKVKAAFMVDNNLNKHFDHAKKLGIPWIVIVGERKIDEGCVIIKNVETREEKCVSSDNFVDDLLGMMNAPTHN